MPTRGKLPRSSASSFPEPELNWTDDLPVCKFTGIGYSTNQIYRNDGHRQEEHSFEDKSFHICYNDSTYLYGVFDGHEGAQAATFALQRVAAELLLGQLMGKTTDEDIKEVLRQAIVAVEKSYLESLDSKIAERTSLQDEIPSDWTSYNVYKQYPDIVDKLEQLNSELSCGTTAVIALVVDNKLYVANVGNSRALLCKTDPNGVLRVIQLSVDHDLSNEDEILRIESLGLKIDKSVTRLGNQENTRCIGNYLVKGAYREFELLANASEEAESYIIAEPEITGGFKIDESCKFLLLMSDGLYKSLEEATGTDQVNKDIAQMAASEFRVQSTLTGVAQQVVDKVVRLHHDNFMSGGCVTRHGKRDDITLLVRNFNQPMPRAASIYSPQLPRLGTVTSLSTVSEDSTNTNCDSQNQSDIFKNPIPAYVDFTEFYKKFEEAKKSGTLPPALLP